MIHSMTYELQAAAQDGPAPAVTRSTVPATVCWADHGTIYSSWAASFDLVIRNFLELLILPCIVLSVICCLLHSTSFYLSMGASDPQPIKPIS